ncbi:HD family phosphohydrolase [Dictyoglomus thermophilum]|uniref:Hdig domain protein n=1 Tax=Dictyoglomus thermophilum (strain ATCC 35947 / DSM 3960 / H-6-12) TaxID=309799 RepID=B5YD89_DICT6|nr:HDIG domain-containing metalloprotein [Dictyoglomus thermophilum]ACI19392.1 hdig domain protein [Dictyoglomus thermophilum H-6-12]
MRKEILNYKGVYKFFKRLKTEVSKNLKQNLTLILTIFLLGDFLILSLDFVFIPPLKINDIAPKDIIATRTVIYRDESETERIKNLMLSQFKPIYTVDQNITIKVLSKLSEVLSPTSEHSEVYNYISKFQLSTVNTIRKKIETWIIENYSKGIKEEEVKAKKQEFIKFLTYELRFPQDIAQKLSDILIVPNMFIDVKETENKKTELIKSIKPIERIISKGDVILRKGEKVTPEKFQILETLGYTFSPKSILRFLCLFLFVALLHISLILILSYFGQMNIKDLNIFLFINSIFLSALAISKIFSFYSTYLAPITTFLFIILSLMDFPDYAILSFLTILLSAIFLRSFIIPIILMFDLIFIYRGLRNLEDRATYLKTSFMLTLIRIPILVLIKYAYPEVYINFSDLFYSIINPIISGILAIGLIPIIEDLFRLASPLKLFELTNPNHPLLRELIMEAPGTYYHSLIVGNLAERAAEESGANPKIVRTASLYHDIGKVKRPQYFIENLLPNQKNPHDDLSPYLSAIIIKSHPKDGAEILNKNKFPKNIIDIVEQHHGTSLLSYFYMKQKQLNPNQIIPEVDFRYPGPKPKSKEAAIVMLADSVEAATRSLKNVTPENIEKVVRDVIRKKLNDGQLENSRLTLEELEKISQSFIKTLIEVRHPRVPYPHEIR